MRYGYDPGCSRLTGAGSSDASVRDVASALGLALEEIEDPFDSATGALAMNGIPAYARVGRLLTLAARQLAGRADACVPPAVVSPCSACFRTLSRAAESLAAHPDLRETVAEELAAGGLSLELRPVRVRHLLDVLLEDAGLDAIRARVTRPLAGLRVAPYYGCLATRSGAPGAGAGAGRRLEEVVAALGAEVVDLPLRDHCCGGRAAEVSEDVAASLQHRILRSARDAGADVVATVCRRCLRNVEAGREPVARAFRVRFATPVRYFTDLVADAFGLGVRS
ncbi:MAG: heterodisulfide reductase-related iron-sulfur binding cluster [Thermoanaerobaculia bacterium]